MRSCTQLTQHNDLRNHVSFLWTIDGLFHDRFYHPLMDRAPDYYKDPSQKGDVDYNESSFMYIPPRVVHNYINVIYVECLSNIPVNHFKMCFFKQFIYPEKGLDFSSIHPFSAIT